jgi:hypothetical protein
VHKYTHSCATIIFTRRAAGLEHGRQDSKGLAALSGSHARSHRGLVYARALTAVKTKARTLAQGLRMCVCVCV